MNEASGQVTEAGTTKTGKPKLKIGGQWYYLGRSLGGASPAVGAMIDLKYSLFGDKGDLRSLEAWKPASGSSQTTSGNTPIPTSLPIDEASLRFISNVVGSAITAGTIKEPLQIEVWFEHAKDAVQGKKRLTQAQLEKIYNKGPVPGVDDQSWRDEDHLYDRDVPF